MDGKLTLKVHKELRLFYKNQGLERNRRANRFMMHRTGCAPGSPTYRYLVGSNSSDCVV
jgi:hypothetical protein